MFGYSSVQPAVAHVPKQTKITDGKRMTVDEYRQYFPKAADVCEAGDSLTYRYLVWCESDPSVFALRARPEPEINRRINGRVLKYTSSAWVRWDTGREEFIHVCHQDTLEENEVGEWVPPDWSRIQLAFRELGLHTRFVTNRFLDERSTRIRNWTILLPWVVRAIADNQPAVVERVARLFEEREQAMSLGELDGHFQTDDPQAALAATVYLIHQGRLHADLDTEPVSRSLTVRLP